MDDLSKASAAVRQQGEKALDKGAGAAQDGIRATKRGAKNAANELESVVDDVRDDAAPLLDKAGDQVERLVDRGQDAWLETTQKSAKRGMRHPTWSCLTPASSPSRRS